MRVDRECIRALIGALVIAASPANAGAEGPSDAPAPQGREGASDRSSSQSTGRVLTGKERLGGKASDEQRLDNCKVPPEKRGPKPRPEACDHDGIDRR